MATRRRSPLIEYMAGKAGLKGDYILDDVHAYGINRETFTIYLQGEKDLSDSVEKGENVPEPGVEFVMANRFGRNLDVLTGISQKRPILIEMSSCGGDFEAGMQIFSKILYCPNPITVLATKWARSMTSIIPLAADKFVIQPPTEYMYHRGNAQFSGLDQEADTNNIRRIRQTEIMYRIYTKRLKSQGKFSERRVDNIRKELEKGTKDMIDVWLSADEAVAWGFADEVFEGNHRTLRTKARNEARREGLQALLRIPIPVKIVVG